MTYSKSVEEMFNKIMLQPVDSTHIHTHTHNLEKLDLIIFTCVIRKINFLYSLLSVGNVFFFVHYNVSIRFLFNNFVLPFLEPLHDR